MTLQSNFSNSVKLAYKNSNKTLAEFSDGIGISRTTLQDILKGNGNSRFDTVEVVAKGLDTEPLALLSTPCAEEGFYGLYFNLAIPSMRSLMMKKKSLLHTVMPLSAFCSVLAKWKNNDRSGTF